MKLGRKGMWELTLIFVVIGLIFMFTIFYAWVSNNITKGEKNTAEVVQSEIELKSFFSQLVQEKGLDLTENDGTATKAIQEFSKKSVDIPKGTYEVNCRTINKDRECTLTVTLLTTLDAVLQYTYYTPVIGQLTYGTWVMLKYIGLGQLKNTIEETYLPTKQGPMNFKLKIQVNI